MSAPLAVEVSWDDATLGRVTTQTFKHRTWSGAIRGAKRAAARARRLVRYKGMGAEVDVVIVRRGRNAARAPWTTVALR